MVVATDSRRSRQATPPLARPTARQSARARPRTWPRLPEETDPRTRTAVAGAATHQQPARKAPEEWAAGQTHGIRQLCTPHRSSTARSCIGGGRCTGTCRWTYEAAARERTIGCLRRGRASAEQSAAHEAPALSGLRERDPRVGGTLGSTVELALCVRRSTLSLVRAARTFGSTR